MPTGTVKWFDPTKGYGFIVPDDGKPDLFVHSSKLIASKIDTVESGYIVSYSEGNRNGKPYAEKLTVISAVAVKPKRQHRSQRGDLPGREATDYADDFEREWGLRRS